MNLEIDWLRDIKESVYSFIQEMNVRKDFSYFKYSYSGDLYDSNIKWGLGQLVFAAKILYMINKIKELTPAHRLILISEINSFQTKDGYCSDTMIFKPNKWRTISNFFKGRKISSSHEQIKRAETIKEVKNKSNIRKIHNSGYSLKLNDIFIYTHILEYISNFAWAITILK